MTSVAEVFCTKSAGSPGIGWTVSGIDYIRISWVHKDAGYPGQNAKYIYITSFEILLQVFKHRLECRSEYGARTNRNR